MPQMDHKGGHQQKPQKYGQLQQPHQFKQQHQYGGWQPQQQQENIVRTWVLAQDSGSETVVSVNILLVQWLNNFKWALKPM